MNHKNIIKSITSISLLFLLTGCAIKQVGQTTEGKTLEEQKIDTAKKIEKIIYERPAVSLLLKDTIRNIIKTMAANDLAKLNQEFIHPEFGFYNLYKLDGYKVFIEQKIIYNIIEEETEEISHIISRVKTASSKLKIIEKNIKFDCSPNDDTFYGWNGDGLYLSNKIDMSLSSMMKDLSTFNLKDYEKAIKIEKTSYKVVLTPELAFYLTKIDNKWYITLIDRISSDCSSIKG